MTDVKLDALSGGLLNTHRGEILLQERCDAADKVLAEATLASLCLNGS